MSSLQLLVLGVLSLVPAVIIIVLIPRTRRAMPFELVMWLATWVIAAIGAWLTLGAVESLPALKLLALVPFAGMPLLPIVLGSFGGALVLTVPMWAADHFGAEAIDHIESE